MFVDLTDSDRPIFFVSDAHLGAPMGPPEREDWLLAVIREAGRDGGRLFVLGDLFDFWFEYRHAIPKGTFRIARALADVIDAGVPVVYLGGNHDFWVGSYLTTELGVVTYQHPITVKLQGRTIHLAHGDGLGPGDGGYKVLKRILRHPLAVAAYRSLHPDVGIPFAYRFSSVSRKHTDPREVILPKILRDVAGPRIRGEVDSMVMGHIHAPCHYQGNGKDFLVLGDWLETFTHARLAGGQFRLLRRRADGGNEEIPAEAFPAGTEPQG
jgi:UDP-2,3-diacylglucosamine hydrolase